MNARFTHSFANKLTSSTNLANVARWLVFALDLSAGALEIIFHNSDWKWSVCSLFPCEADSIISRRPPVLTSDVLIHPVPSTQALQHAALYCTCVFSPISPLLHLHYHHIVFVFTPPANPAHTQDRHACAVCHLWATWSHWLPSLYVHMRKYLLFLRLIIICAAILRPKCHWRRVEGGGGGGGGGDDEGCWCHWCCLATNVCFQLAGFGCRASE